MELHYISNLVYLAKSLKRQCSGVYSILVWT